MIKISSASTSPKPTDSRHKYSPMLPSALRERQINIKFFNDNIKSIFSKLLALFPIFLLLLCYCKIRKEKVKEIQGQTSLTDLYAALNKKHYDDNDCAAVENDTENSPPILVRKCMKFAECMKKEEKKPTVAKLVMAQAGMIIQDFIKELNASTVAVIFSFLSLNILIDSLRNRRKVGN